MTASATARTPRLAVNPIGYWLVNGRIDRSKPVLDRAFAELSSIGYTAVKADVPAGMSSDAYLAWLASYGLVPSVSLFNSMLDERVEADTELERARVFAAQQVAIGMDRTMVSSAPLPARWAVPAVGAGYRAERFEQCVDLLGRICEVMTAGGVRPLLHNHIGGVFETGDELDRVLASIPEQLLGIGPDTGHLRWAGVDPAAFVDRHSHRIGAIHLKDVYPDLLPAHGEGGPSYTEASASKRLWSEPGYGVVDFAALLDALPPDYDGDYMIEVDEPSTPTVRESMERSFEWAMEHLGEVLGRAATS
jgi:inosose dehydratase